MKSSSQEQDHFKMEKNQKPEKPKNTKPIICQELANMLALWKKQKTKTKL